MKKALKVVLIIIAVIFCSALGFGYWLANGDDTLVIKQISQSGYNFTFLFPKTSLPAAEKSSLISVSDNIGLGITIHEINSISDKNCQQRDGREAFKISGYDSENSSVCSFYCNINTNVNQCYTLNIATDSAKSFEAIIFGNDIYRRENEIKEIMNSIRFSKATPET